MIASLLQIVVGATGTVGFLLRHIGPITIATVITLIGISLFEVVGDMASAQWGVAVMCVVHGYSRATTISQQYFYNIKKKQF